MRCAWRCDSCIKVGLYFWHIIFAVIGIGNERDNQVFEVNATAYLVYTLLQEALPVTRARSCNQRSTYAEHRSLPAHTILSVSPALCIDVQKLRHISGEDGYQWSVEQRARQVLYREMIVWQRQWRW